MFKTVLSQRSDQSLFVSRSDQTSAAPAMPVNLFLRLRILYCTTVLLYYCTTVILYHCCQGFQRVYWREWNVRLWWGCKIKTIDHWMLLWHSFWLQHNIKARSTPCPGVILLEASGLGNLTRLQISLSFQSCSSKRFKPAQFERGSGVRGVFGEVFPRGWL